MTSRAETVTILFTDLVGSTELLQRSGDERTQRIVRAHYKLLRDAVSKAGGHEVKTLGDGLMVAFPSAVDAIRCAIAMQQASRGRTAGEQLQIRVGLNVGEAIHDEADYFGTPVVVARRLCDYAGAGQILASETIARLLEGRPEFSFQRLGDLELKGLAAPVSAVEVLYGHKALPLAARTPFVGREAELGELERALEEAAAGRGSMVLIGGEPGIGKSRLTNEIASIARERGWLSITGQCYEAESPAFIPFVEIIEQAARLVAPEAFREAVGDGASQLAKLAPGALRQLGDVPSSPQVPVEQERRYLFNCVSEFIERLGSGQPLVLVIEDLHWADESSLTLVRHLAPQLERMSVLLVGTYRDVELAVTRPLATTVEELHRSRLTRLVDLKRLSSAEVAAMLHALSGREPPDEITQAIAAETDGNPFFLEEVVRQLTDEGALFDAEGGWTKAAMLQDLGVPRGLRLVLGRRLARLGEDTRRVLTIAAVAGRGFSFELLSALDEVAADALLDAIDAAQRAHLIGSASDAGGAHLTFAHELVRQELLAELSLPRRQGLHVRLAEAIKTSSGAGQHAADIAYHLQQAGAAADAQETLHYLKLAGDQAMARTAFLEALAYYQRALQLAEAEDTPPEPATCELLLAVGSAAWASGDLTLASETFQRAAELAKKLGAGELLARAALGLGEGWGWVSETLLLRLLEDALEALPPEHLALRARSLARLADAIIGSWGSLERGRALANEAVQLARRSEDDGALAYALIQWLNAHAGSLRPEERFSVASEVIELAEHLDESSTAYGYEHRIVALAQLGEMHRLDADIDTLSQLAGRTRLPFALWYAQRYRGSRALMRGSFAEAEQLLQERLAMRNQMGSFPGGLASVTVAVFVLRREQGRLAELEEGVRGFAHQAPPHLHYYRAAQALLYSESDRSAESRIIFDQVATEGFRAPGDEFEGLLTLALLSEVCGYLGDAARARTLYELLLPYEPYDITDWWADAFLGAAPRLLGVLAMTMSRWEEAERHFEDALRRNERVGSPPWLAHTQHQYARMLMARRGAGDREKALRLLEKAATTARELDMSALLGRVSALLESRPTAFPAGLTPREAEILRLIAAGKSSREIADDLVLSVRTVDRHIANIYRKIDANGRAQATAFALAHGIASPPGAST